MLDILETVFYVVILALFLTTFMPARIRRNVAESTGALWRMCGELLRALEPYAFRLVTGKEKPGATMTASRAGAVPVASRDDRPNRTPVFAAPGEEKSRSDAVEPPHEPVRSVREADDSLLLTREEIGAVARMIGHNKTAAKPTKSSSIEAGFGLKRGGGPAYARASAIYDRLFAAPSAALYPTLTAEREKVGREMERA